MSALDDVLARCEFRCLCFENPERRDIMTAKFAAIGLPLQVYAGVPHSDPRIANVDGRDISDALRRLWSVTYGHLDMIRMFLESGKDFGLFCEYDVMISKALSQQLPALMADYAEMQLDVMLLGYMTTFKIEGWHAGYATRSVSSERPHLYHNYPDHQWGVHLYMLDRAGAQKALDAFAHGYADANVADPNKPFSPDWTISKLANRALVYPMLAVEDGTDSFAHYGHQGQYDFHMNTFRANFVPGEFV